MKDYEFVQENSQNFRGTESVDSVYRRAVDLIEATEKIAKNEGPMSILFYIKYAPCALWGAVRPVVLVESQEV